MTSCLILAWPSTHHILFYPGSSSLSSRLILFYSVAAPCFVGLKGADRPLPLVGPRSESERSSDCMRTHSHSHSRGGTPRRDSKRSISRFKLAFWSTLWVGGQNPTLDCSWPAPGVSSHRDPRILRRFRVSSHRKPCIFLHFRVSSHRDPRVFEHFRVS